jgi:beta-barrel assembly-enhancing protease
MLLIRLLLLAIVAATPRAWAQALPDLGGAGDAVLSPQVERRLGENIVRDIRFREPGYIDDPEVSEYLAQVGARLAQATSGSRLDFDFFVIRDPSINAFALPGGFVGVHTGLIQAADTESQLASVLAHEVAHVTQRHIARMLGQQQQMQMPMMVALAAALLLGQSRPDLMSGAAAAIQAGVASSTLSYSRDFEREADRIGLQALAGAGFDARAMSAFFEKLQRHTRVSDDGTMPGYMRSHPVTTERIADAQNKSAGLPYKQHLDSDEFHFVRAKLRAEGGDARDALVHFQGSLKDKRYARESAARYGLVSALVRSRRGADAAAEMERLRASGARGPMIESLAARVKRTQGDTAGAGALLRQARVRYPHSRPLLYAHVEAMHDAGQNTEALAQVGEAQRAHPRDARLFALQAKTYAALGKRLLQHQAQAEFYVLQGSVPAAIEQLQLARTAGDGDFYQLSVVDARLKDLRAQHGTEAAPKR